MASETKFKETEIGMIPKNWNLYKLSDVVEIIGGGTPKTSVKEYWGGEIPWLSVVDFNNDNRLVHKTEKTITEKGLKESSTKILKKGQIIISARGTVGEMAQLACDMAFNQSCYGLNGKKQIINDFLYYLLKNNIRDLKKNTHGSVFDTITRNTFDQIFVNVPPIEEQKLISGIFTSLDDKIDLNRQMNSTLEQISQTLFKHWFIDFEFPDENGNPYKSSGGRMVDSELGEIPEGWEIKPVGELADFVKGFSYKGSEKFTEPSGKVFITLNNVYEGGGFKPEYAWIQSERVKERHLIREGDLIIPNTEQTKDGRLLGFPAIVYFPHDYKDETGVFSHHITKIAAFDSIYKNYLYFYLYFTQVETSSYHTGSVIWGLDVNSLKKNKWVVKPPANKIEMFNRIVDKLLKKIINNQKENKILSQTRDYLLPKLISGKIRI